MSMNDPIQSALETFEAARLKYVAMYDHASVVTQEVEAALGPSPPWAWAYDEARAKRAECDWWQAQRRRLVAAQLGTDEDSFCNPHRVRMEGAYAALDKFQATTVDELLCQLRAWRCVEECCVDETSSEWRMILRLLKDLERLAGELRS